MLPEVFNLLGLAIDKGFETVKLLLVSNFLYYDLFGHVKLTHQGELLIIVELIVMGDVARVRGFVRSLASCYSGQVVAD
jgi:hypothetical protein